jgi:CRISPR-associated endonuclease/helicase Cas3
MEADDSFASSFRALTRDGRKNGYEPLRWQRRLFEDYFSRNHIPTLCDLPTGLGKTSVILVWLIALRRQVLEGKKERLPTRLVYVVDRRTVVDQATTLAERIKENLKSLDGGEDWVTVSTLRGQLADNREWTVDPSKPAIVIGTVDMIGSRLLFSGYRSSYKRRPLEAGLLGQDTLLVLDEAHLSAPFAKLVQEISDRGSFQRDQGLPIRVMRMSATSADDEAERFKLEEFDLKGKPETNPIIRRFEAKKRLYIKEVEKDKLRKSIVEAACDLARDNSRVVVFVRRPDDAFAIAKAIVKQKPFRNAVEVLTGTMRGLERDEFLDKSVLKRFLDGGEKPEDCMSKPPAILVSTSAGEVGFDLNADHMVCDGAPLDSMIQRLGRANRRGYGDAIVRVFAVKADEATERGSRRSKHTVESAAGEAMRCLGQLDQNNSDGSRNASPKAIDNLKAQLTKEQLVAASAPKPATVELTDILLDAWSMTTITQPMPGRPPVAAWLRGLDGDEPQTTIAWRAELDLEGFDRLDIDEIEEWFDAHRILPHETLSVPTSKASEWIRERWKQLPEELRDSIGERSCTIDRAGLEMVKLKVLVEDLERKPTDRIFGAHVVLPASFGGIERGRGLLDEAKPDPTAPDSLKAPDVADARGRCRRLVVEGELPVVLTEDCPGDVSAFARFALDLPSTADRRRQIESLVPKRERLDFGTRKQALWRHVGLVRKHARDLISRLPLSPEVSQAAQLSAAWHDHGKNRDIWQQAVGGKSGESPLGKSGGSMGRIPGNYRHEFGSLREFIDKHQGELPDAIFDLAMHLIAAHHGQARPHFSRGGFDPLARAKSPQIAVDVIRRFARLQRNYGYWQLAYLESLLRCADAMASADGGKR